MKHVKLNGIWYRLAEDAEGQHYVKSLQPLRPPNSQLVQGDTGKFQIRPDVLLWTATNWSGGEGQLKFDPQDPNRSFIIQHADPFSRPGSLMGSYAASIAQNNAASDVGDGYLCIAQGTLYWVDGTTVRTWDIGSSNFSATETITGLSGSAKSPVGDAEYLFVVESGSDEVFRRTSGGTWAVHNDQCANVSDGVIVAELGPYVYLWSPTSGTVYEISKETANTSTPEVAIHDVPKNSAINTDSALMVAGDNRVYLATHDDQKTMVHEILPTSAAGAGFGYEIAVMYGVIPEALFYAGGTLFMIGVDEEPDNSIGPDRQIYYIDPEGSYGTLGSVRGLYTSETGTAGPSESRPFPAHGGKLGLMAFALPSNTDDEDEDDTHLDLWLVDLITGGYACVAGDEGLLGAASDVKGLVFWDGQYFASNATEVVVWDPDAHTGDASEVISPANDFGVAGEKILERIEVICEPLPADTVIQVGYQLDEGSKTTTALSLATGDTGGALEPTNPPTFRSMKYIVEASIGTGSVIPVIQAVNVYARVNERVRVWELLLDASDGAVQPGYNGAQIVDNVLGIADNTVVPFIDGYTSHAAGEEASEVDVVIDSASFVASQEGEGVIVVRLMEVL